MARNRDHKGLETLKTQFNDGKMSRREFIRYSTLLGVSATTAYGMVGMVAPRPVAAADMPKGGIVRISMRVLEVTSPHTYSWLSDSNQGRGTHEYLTKTGQDNVTRPYLIERWEASEDLKTWTMHLRKVKWHNGRDFTADDAIWNINRCLQPDTGSSVLGLMKGYMLEEYDTGEKKDDGSAKMSTRLWDTNALEKIDDHTFRMNLKEAQVAVPEHLFHYPLPMLDPEENGMFGPGSNGTGPFDLVEQKVGDKAVLRARGDYWGDGPYIDELHYIDLGDDPSAFIGAMASQQVHGQYDGDVGQLDVLQNLPHVTIHQALTASTGVRPGAGRPAGVRRPPAAQGDAPRGGHPALPRARPSQPSARPASTTTCARCTPTTRSCPSWPVTSRAAKQLLAEAGYPDGIDVEIASKKDPAWELQAVQAMVEQWKDANIRVNINLMPSAQFWDVWDKVPFGFTSWAHRPLGFMVLALGYRSGVPWNESHFNDAEFDSLLTKAEGTLDLEERREILGQIEVIMQERGPITQPLWRAGFVAMDKRITGFTMHPTGYIFGEEIGLQA